MKSTLDNLLEESVEKQHLQGVSFSVASKSGIQYEGAAGFVAPNGNAMTCDTVAAIYSMTKAVTGTAAMQLVEQG